MSEQNVEHHLKVIVNYPAAKRPFEQEHTGRSETVGVLKSAVLKAFGLTEGQSDGNTYTYTLFHEKRPLENLSETLGQVAGHAATLVLKLSQQVTQG
jgi:hypothetical protein